MTPKTVHKYTHQAHLNVSSTSVSHQSDFIVWDCVMCPPLGEQETDQTYNVLMYHFFPLFWTALTELQA